MAVLLVELPIRASRLLLFAVNLTHCLLDKFSRAIFSDQCSRTLYI